MEKDTAGRSYDIAIEHHRSGRNAKALTILDTIIASFPRMASLHIKKGSILYEMKQFDRAVASFEAALTIDSRDPDTCFSKGAALQAQGKLEEALRSYNQSLELQPNHAFALNNRGLALRDCGQMADALRSYDAAIEALPECPDFYFGKAMCLLLLGRFQEGWSLFEWRRSKIQPVASPPSGSHPWRGEDIAGKVLLIQAEQGLGDTIQFCRFASLAKGHGATVVLQVQERLVRLLQTLPFPVSVIGSEAALPACDYHVMLLSMPLHYAGAIPAEIPYLAAEPEKVLGWRTRLEGPGFKIGICWQGERTWQGEEKSGDVGRSFPLILFEKISKFPNVHLISLQKNEGVEQLNNFPDRIVVESFGVDFDSGPHSFLDTAAVIESLDLVITADTAIAHLAGAMGRPVWLALKHVPDWRWLLDRNDSPWYPSMRLFRQKASGDWAGVFDQMEHALLKCLAGTHSLGRRDNQSE